MALAFLIAAAVLMPLALPLHLAATALLFAGCLLPFVVGMSGYLYLFAAVILGLGFCGYGWALLRNYSDALARKTFRFSLIHLSLLFAALLVDHYLA